MSNTSKGAARLANVLQKRINAVSKRAASGINAELGTITAGKKLRVDSLPDVAIDDDDYYVCKTISDTKPLKNGDRVLVTWTHLGEAIVIDKIVKANKA